MQLKSIIAVLAAGLSMVAAEVDSTTTSTQTLTKTVTITECNPTATNCPGRTETTTSTTTTWTFPLSNSTSTVGPTASSSFILSSSRPVITGTSGQVIPTGSQTQAPTSIATAGAAGLFIQPALLLGALGAGVALLA
ncbi:hypothetical protein MFIFM68171_00542 [Madurella fahalii]|uniref:Uncharacterized protein n=1 Tax=Madurella fahalii TaxID=1157608 RepID=A0ABQ0FXU3_9PEZI